MIAGIYTGDDCNCNLTGCGCGSRTTNSAYDNNAYYASAVDPKKEENEKPRDPAPWIDKFVENRRNIYDPPYSTGKCPAPWKVDFRLKQQRPRDGLR